MERHQWCEGLGVNGRRDDLLEVVEVAVELAREKKVGELEGAMADGGLSRRVQ